MSSELVPIADRELWVVVEKGKDFQLPVYCDPYSSNGNTCTHYVVRPAIDLLAEPHAELEAQLRKHDVAGTRSYWVIEREVLPNVAKKAPGITPAYYFRWKNTEVPQIQLDGEQLPDKPNAANSFLEFVAKRSAINFSTIRVVWSEIERLALDWLLDKQQPLYFNFMHIYPVPYRVNWKEIMLAKHPGSVALFRKAELEERDALLASCGFIQDLASTDMLAMHRRHCFQWTLECVPTDRWRKQSVEVELTRLGIKGAARYASYYEGRLRYHLAHILTIYKAWLGQMAHPVGKLGESRISGKPVLMLSNRGTLLPGRGSRFATSLKVESGELALKDGKRDQMAKEATRLLEMSDLPADIEDMWGGDEPAGVGESADEGDGAGGLSLLAPGQGPDA